MNGLHAGVHPPVARHGAEGEGPDASPLMGAEIHEHASRVASRVPHFGNETFSTGNMVNGFIDHLPSVSPADTSFACFVAGEGHGG